MKRTALLSAGMLVMLTACQKTPPSNDEGVQTPAMEQATPATGNAQATAQAAQTAAASSTSADASSGSSDVSSAPMTQPDWFHYDKASNKVDMTITAGLTPALNHWNYNGGHNGNMIITVPKGAAVALTLKNADPAMSHSLGIVDKVGGYSATVTLPPVFDGAITTPHTAATGVPSGKSQTIHFTASKAGKYAAVCYMAGHAATGMWIRFNVSAEGKAGVQSTSSTSG